MLQSLRDTDQKQFVRNKDMSGNIPDGVVNFTTVNENKLEYIFAVNDHKYYSNHIGFLSIIDPMESQSSVQKPKLQIHRFRVISEYPKDLCQS